MNTLQKIVIASYIILTVLISFELGVKYTNYKIDTCHKCIDSTHETCDGSCECDGMECITPAFGTNPRMYQITDIYHQMIYIYDGERLVDSLSYKESGALGKIILKDNE